MRVISVIGLLGSGKTRLIRLLLAEAAARGERPGVIVNQSGETSLDDLEARFPVEAIGGG